MVQDTPENPFMVTLNHSNTKIDDVIGYPTKIWRATKKYSVNNTLPIAAVNTWLQFSLAYIAAVIITHNNLSYITDIFNSQLMPAYALASVILGTILLTSLAIKHVYKQEIEDEKSKSGASLIDEKIRGGESDGINEIAQNASVIEIVPDLRRLVDKKQGFSIVLPIFGKQGEMLENKKQENRNKIILLTVPYVLGGLIVAGALAKFGFVHIRGWEEWAFIAAVGIVAIVGICVTLSKLKSNEVNNASNIVKKFDNVDILLPWRKGSVVSVMENKFESKEENDPISRLENLLNKHLTDFTDKIVYSFNKHLGEAKDLLDKKLLEPANIQIKETLVHLKGIREYIQSNLDKLHTEITGVLNGIKNLTGKVSQSDIENIKESIISTLDALKSKVAGFQPSWLLGSLTNTGSSEQPRNEEAGEAAGVGSGEIIQKEIKKLQKGIEELQKEVMKEVNKLKEELAKRENKPIDSETSSTTSNDSHQEKEKKAREKNELLKSQQRTKELEKENAELEKELSEQEITDERQKKINGKPRQFLYYLLESIKLEEKDDQGKKVDEATLRNFDNKIIIHWKDGSQTTCHIPKRDNPLQPGTKINFVDQKIHAAFKEACVE